MPSYLPDWLMPSRRKAITNEITYTVLANLMKKEGESYITRCYIETRQDDPPIFEEIDGRMIVRLNGYAIVPIDDQFKFMKKRQVQRTVITTALGFGIGSLIATAIRYFLT